MSFAGNGIMAVFSVVTYGLLFRMLGVADMGNWIFFQFAFILVDTIRSGFLQTAVVKFYAGATGERANTVAGSMWFIALIITGIVILLDLLFLPFIGHIGNPGLELLVKWLGISVFLTLPFTGSTWILQAVQGFDKILYIRIVNQGSFLALIVFFFFNSGHALTLTMVLYSFLLSSLAGSLFCLFNKWTALSFLAVRSRACIMELFHFGKYSVGTVLSSNFLKSSDTFIVNFMLGPAALAIYNLPQRLMEIIEIPIRSFIANAMPTMSAAANKNDMRAVTAIMQKYAGLLTLLLIPVAAGSFFLADFFVGLIGGGKYVHTEAANVFRIFMVFSVFSPIDRFMGITLDIINKPRLNFIKVILSLVINAVTDVIGIYLLHNVYGPSLASIFTFIAAMLYGYFVLRKYLDFKPSGFISTGYISLQVLVMNYLVKRKIAKS
jgi:O-antigen/teichoic acid export membrane protein